MTLYQAVAALVYLGWSIDVAGVVADLQGAEHRRQDGGQEGGCQMTLQNQQC